MEGELGLCGRFELLEVVGEGASGRVYRALDPRLGREVAVKVLRRLDDVHRARMLREALLQWNVDHPAVCRVYEVGEWEGVPFVAMQLVRGPSLASAAASMGLEEKVEVLARAAEGIHEAHRLGVVHRDIKPANILVEQDSDGRWKPYVTDFGLARDPGARG